MRAVAKIDEQQIEDMDLEITFRMKVSEWRKLMKEQTHVWPSSDLCRHIGDVLEHISKATTKTFTPSS